MTKILIDRATVEQALEALEFVTLDFFMLNPISPGRKSTIKAITALRAALAEPQSTHSADCYQWHHKCAIAEVERLRAALTEPVQEPVAWMYTGIKQDGTEHGPHLVWKPAYMDAMSASKGVQATPLYTAPPQRKENT